MADTLLMQNHRPKIHESGRVLAFQIVNNDVWELTKMSNADRWQLTKNGCLWMESSHKDRIYDVFNELRRTNE